MMLKKDASDFMDEINGIFAVIQSKTNPKMYSID